jgi:hypothetical protein
MAVVMSFSGLNEAATLGNLESRHCRLFTIYKPAPIIFSFTDCVAMTEK